MVIVIMGDVESPSASVGALLAESLGWEFLDTEKQSLDARGDQEGILRVEVVREALDSSIYRWRDIVVSCPTLAEQDQKNLCDNRSVVKFVHLKRPQRTDSKLPLDLPPEVVSLGVVAPNGFPHMRGKNLLTLSSSLSMEQIVEAVINRVVLRPSTDFDAVSHTGAPVSAVNGNVHGDGDLE